MQGTVSRKYYSYVVHMFYKQRFVGLLAYIVKFFKNLSNRLEIYQATRDRLVFSFK